MVLTVCHVSLLQHHQQPQDGSFSSGGTDAIDQRLAGFLPLGETIDLQDYRNRYASYSRDEALQNLLRRVPIMAIWDDHELSNNASGDETRYVVLMVFCAD